MANYGYLPRNGIITAEQAISASKDVFNMDYDLGAFLSFEAVAFGGNLATSVFSSAFHVRPPVHVCSRSLTVQGAVGGEDARTYSSTGIGSKEVGRQYGLDAHGRVEGDASATRQDYNLNDGDNHSGIPSWFARLVDAAKVNGGEFNHAATNALYGQNARLSLANNPTSVWQAHTIVVTLAEYGLITEFVGNGGVANYDSVAPFMGFETSNNGTVCAVFEHFPKNWFRRSTPYGLVDGVVGNLVPTFLSGPLLPNPLQDYFTTASIGGLGCALYQHFKNGLTVEMTGQSQAYTAQMNVYLQQKLLPALPVRRSPPRTSRSTLTVLTQPCSTRTS
ncbi:SPOSA6832_03225, partial [Sporobolomyces salmonicolor]